MSGFDVAFEKGIMLLAVVLWALAIGHIWGERISKREAEKYRTTPIRAYIEKDEYGFYDIYIEVHSKAKGVHIETWHKGSLNTMEEAKEEKRKAEEFYHLRERKY